MHFFCHSLSEVMGLRNNLLPLLYVLGGVVAQTPTVTLDTGIWKGVPTQQAGSSISVHKYLGLPFAAPPVRFSPPQPPASSTAQRNADKLPPACIQNGGSGFSQGSIPESENCLYLNIFAPAAMNSSNSSKTVMVWFFGGALQFGTASMTGYDGTSFATNQDVILVAPNYRTNSKLIAYGNGYPYDLLMQKSSFRLSWNNSWCTR